MQYPFFSSRTGQISIQLLIFSVAALSAISGLTVWAYSIFNSSVRDFRKTLAFSIAEAGVEYYRWHLAHAPTDYQDGTGTAGPYVHDYYDKDGNVIGNYTLTITPPPVGSRVVTVRSTAHLVTDTSIQKAIEVKLGIPSLAKYAVGMNANVRFGVGTEVFGPIHSNGGIRFDGLAHNLVSSAVGSYDDPDHTGGNEFGVHTHVSPVDPLPPAAVPSRPDVFAAGRAFPLPALDFSGITQTLSQLKSDASSTGFYRASSTAFGYEVVFKTNDTFDLNKVTALAAAPRNCTNSQNQTGWGTWSIQSTSSLGNFSMPANGLIFLEDNVWVRGQVNGQRVTVGAGAFPDTPATWKSITVNRDLLYSLYDGSDTIGLIAQGDINVGLYSSDVLRIDAALIAQNGRAGRYYYGSSCGAEYKRSSLTSYGMIASNQRYGFAYTDGTGYTVRTITYDPLLLYGPPPSFPLVGDQYVLLSWEEIQ